MINGGKIQGALLVFLRQVSRERVAYGLRLWALCLSGEGGRGGGVRAVPNLPAMGMQLSAHI